MDQRAFGKMCRAIGLSDKKKMTEVSGKRCVYQVGFGKRTRWSRNVSTNFHIVSKEMCTSPWTQVSVETVPERFVPDYVLAPRSRSS